MHAQQRTYLIQAESFSIAYLAGRIGFARVRVLAAKPRLLPILRTAPQFRYQNFLALNNNPAGYASHLLEYAKIEQAKGKLCWQGA